MVSLVVGCRTSQPTISTTEKTITFDSAQFLNKIIECNEFGELVVSWYGLAQLENDSLRYQLKAEKAKSDSLKRINKPEESRIVEKGILDKFKGKLIKPITATIKETTQKEAPCKPEIIEVKKTPVWTYFSL